MTSFSGYVAVLGEHPLEQEPEDDLALRGLRRDRRPGARPRGRSAGSSPPRAWGGGARACPRGARRRAARRPPGAPGVPSASRSSAASARPSSPTRSMRTPSVPGRSGRGSTSPACASTSSCLRTEVHGQLQLARRASRDRRAPCGQPADDPQAVPVHEGAEAGEQVGVHAASLGQVRTAARLTGRARRRSVTRSGTTRSATLRPMLPNGRRLGAHLPLGHGMVKAADRAAEIGASALQVFSDNPTSWRRRPTLPARAAGLPGASRRARHRAARDPRPVPRQPRRAGPRDCTGAPWTSWPTSCAWPRRTGRGSSTSTSARTGARARRPGSTASREGSLRSSSGRRRRARRRSSSSRTAPGGGFGLGCVDRGARRHRRGRRGGRRRPRERFGFCLDTAHLWGAGYPIDTAVGRGRDPRGLRRAGGPRAAAHGPPQRLALGARVADGPARARGRGADRRRRASRAWSPTRPWITSSTSSRRPGMDDGYDAVNIARVQDLAHGRPLAALPPAAFHTRSAKGRSAPADDDGPAAARMTPRSAPGASSSLALLGILVLAALTPPAGPRRPRPLGRRPGHGHAGPARAGGRRRGPAAGPEDVDRDVPPRGRLLLPAGARRRSSPRPTRWP